MRPGAVILATTLAAASLQISVEPRERRMSFHNRLLLNRAVVTGLQSIEVLLLVEAAALTRTAARVETLGGRVYRTEAAIGYLRVHIPLERLLDLVSSRDIEAYQITPLSRGA
jgi:hypothetical protein